MIKSTQGDSAKLVSASNDVANALGLTLLDLSGRIANKHGLNEQQTAVAISRALAITLATSMLGIGNPMVAAMGDGELTLRTVKLANAIGDFALDNCSG